MASFANQIGVSLSGGGYRASAFHLGTLNKLNELGILEKVDVLSTISGGSITGAAWCLHKEDYESFHKKMIYNLNKKGVIKRIIFSWTFWIAVIIIVGLIANAVRLTFLPSPLPKFSFPLLILALIIILKFQFQIFPVSEVIERAYDDIFFNKKTLKDLKERPVLAIGSSNLETGRPFTFSQIKMSDSTYSDVKAFGRKITFKHKEFPVARAVMASSCVPFAFTPVFIKKKFYTITDDFSIIKPVLIDGGVYDNQGIQKLTEPKSSYHCKVVITSDAGGKFIGQKKYPNAIALLIRTVDLFMYRIKTSQMVKNIYQNVEGANRPIAYFSLGWELDQCITGFINNLFEGLITEDVLKSHGITKEMIAENTEANKELIKKHIIKKVGFNTIKDKDLSSDNLKIARSTSTNLKRLSKERIEYLVTHAENLTELQVRLYCPMLIEN